MAANDVVWPAALSVDAGVRHGAPVIVVGGHPASLTACDGDVGTAFGLTLSVALYAKIQVAPQMPQTPQTLQMPQTRAPMQTPMQTPSQKDE